MKRICNGFTIIELMITIVIVAIIATLAVSGIGWIGKYSVESSAQQVKSFISYVRNNAILTNTFTCVQKNQDADKFFLTSSYLLATNKDDTKKQQLWLKENITIANDGADKSSDNLVCFYPNGFLVKNSTISPKNSDLSSIMRDQTTDYYAFFNYSDTKQLKITITKTDTDESKSICLANGGEFQTCL